MFDHLSENSIDNAHPFIHSLENVLMIDVHTHILPPYIPNWESKFGYPGFIGLEDIKDEATTDKKMMKGDRFFRRVQCNCFDHGSREVDMIKSSVSMQVLSTVPAMFNYWAKPQDCLETSRYINDHIARVCSANPDKFIGLGTIPMQDVDLACEELKRCVIVLKLKGVEIGTHINEKNLDDEMFEPFWKCVEELGAVVFVHPWDMMGGQRLEKHWLSWLVSMPTESAAAISCMIFGGVYKRYPNLKVYYAHGGGSFIGILARIQQGYICRPDLFPEQCDPKNYLKHIMVDSLTHDPDMLQLLLKHIGPDNVMIGSDYPFPLGEPDNVGKAVKNLLLKREDGLELRRKIFYQNACKFFNIDISTFNSQTSESITKLSSYINEIILNPVQYCNTLTNATLGLVLAKLCKVYYDNNPYVDNTTYDTMVDNLRTRDANNTFFLA